MDPAPRGGLSTGLAISCFHCLAIMHTLLFCYYTYLFVVLFVCMYENRASRDLKIKVFIVLLLAYGACPTWRIIYWFSYQLFSLFSYYAYFVVWLLYIFVCCFVVMCV